MANFKRSSTRGRGLKRRLSPSVQNSPQIVENSVNFKSLPEPSQRKNSDRYCSGFIKKGGDSQSFRPHHARFLQSGVSCPKAKSKVETCDRSEPSKPSFNCNKIQDGNRRNYSKIVKKGRMGDFNRHKRCVSPCPHSQEGSEISQVPNQTGGLPICVSPFRHSDSPSRIHPSCKGSEATSQIQRSKDAPVLGRLAAQIRFQRKISSRHSKASKFGTISGLASELRQVGINPKSEVGLSGLSFRLGKRASFSNFEKFGKISPHSCFLQKKPIHLGKVLNVPDRPSSQSRKNCPSRQTSHSPISMALKEPLEMATKFRQNHPSHNRPSKTSKVVGISPKPNEGIPTTSHRTHSISFYRCFKQRLGGSPGGPKSPRPLVRSRETPPYQSFRAQSNLSGSKKFRKAATTTKRLDMFRQCFSSSLLKQTGRYKIASNGSNDMEDLLLVNPQRDPGSSSPRSWVPQCDSGLSVQGRHHSPDRVVPSPKNIKKNMPGVAHASNRHVCHIPKCQTEDLHFSNPGPKGLESGCPQHTLAGPRRVCLLSNRHHPSTGPKNVDLSVPNDSDSSRVARDGLVLGPLRALNQATPQTTPVEVPVETTSQQVPPQEPGISQSTCLESRFQRGQPSGLSSTVENRVRAPQRQSSRAVYSARWTLFRTWCEQNQVDVSSPSIPRIADFLLHLFEEKGLQPSTISGYRTAIADGFGSNGLSVSNSRDLNRLLASFHRDRPRAHRAIPSWDLSLVLLSLTKKPFEPLRSVDLKYLTLKTVFLLALASGKRRGEIHAWLESSVFFKSDGSKVTVSPSPAFLAKNQLASEGPASVQPVVIPALGPGLDLELTEDRSLCPVRALRIYLDRTKDFRKGKNLLFISLKKGHSKDIAKATISHWIKETVKLAYDSADSETLQVSRVKAHEVRAMASSLAFKGGIPLDQILSSCYWRSHGTFTSFYLKDLCWQNDNIFKLGPLVAAQHIVSSRFRATLSNS